ncbi:hypothetical protein RF55_18606, partial [Lasius niger]
MKIAYKLAKRENKDYPPKWNEEEQADLEWIYEYEMRHYDEISNLEGPNSCLVESQASAITQLLTSFDKQQISKPMSTSRRHLQEAIPSTSRGHLQGDIEQEQDPNALEESVKKDTKILDDKISILGENVKKDIKTLEMQMVTYVGIMKWSATLLVTLVLGVISILVKV